MIVGLAVGYSAGRFSGPTSVESTHVEHAQVEAREKVAEKVDEETVTVNRWRPALNPVTGQLVGGCDGGVIMEGESVTSSKRLSDLTRATDFKTASGSTSSTKVEARPDWRAHVLVGAAFSERPSPDLAVGGMLERRLLGEMTLGVFGLVNVPTVTPTADLKPRVTVGIAGGYGF